MFLKATTSGWIISSKSAQHCTAAQGWGSHPWGCSEPWGCGTEGGGQWAWGGLGVSLGVLEGFSNPNGSVTSCGDGCGLHWLWGHGESWAPLPSAFLFGCWGSVGAVGGVRAGGSPASGADESPMASWQLMAGEGGCLAVSCKHLEKCSSSS